MPEQRTAAFLKEYGLWGGGARCLIAVSGGVDSMVLLRVLHRLRDEAGLVLFAAHLDHGLRPEAGEDAAFVRAQCAALGIPCTVGRASVGDWLMGRSPEMAARDIRRQFLLATAGACGARWILTAHHGDDQLETVLMRLTRGTTLTGLRGMVPCSGSFGRPLLELSRSEILDYAREQGIPWVEDRTNGDETMDRNRVRHRLVPLLRQMNPRVHEAVGRLSASLKQDEDFIMAHAAEAISAIGQAGDTVLWPCRSLHPALLGRVAVAMMDRAGMTLFSAADVQRLCALSCGAGPERITLPQGRMAQRHRGHILIYPAASAPPPEPRPLPIPGEVSFGRGYFTVTRVEGPGEDGPFVQHFDGDGIPRELTARTRQEGDRIRPLGAAGVMTLKKAMNMRHIPPHEREHWPVVTAGDRVLWVPGANLMDGRAAHSEGTVRWLRIEYIGEEKKYHGYYL